MKKSLLLITMLLLSAAWVVAQSMPSGQSTSPSSPSATSPSSPTDSQSGAADQSSAKASASADTSIRGCLSGSAGNYTLADSASGKSYNLSGKTDDLSAHVGQEVELQGSSASASAGMGSSSASNPSSSASNAGAASASGSSSATGSGQAAAVASNFDVKSVTKIADTCSSK